MTVGKGGCMPVRRSSSRRWLGLLTSVLALVLACEKGAKQPPPPRPTLPPSFTGAQVDSVPLARIREYADNLQFDTTPGAFDERRVDFRNDRLDSGPSARIEPEVGSAVVDSTALAQGRIVARIRSDSTYPQAGFGPWWTYWWVDKQGGHWRSLFIRSDSGSKPRVPTGFVLYHPPRPDYAPACPTSRGAACARFNKGSAGTDVSLCHQCSAGWCSGSVPAGP